MTSYETPQLLSKIKHWDRQQRKKIEIECPTVICTYNKDVRKDVRGVDLLDAFLSYYQIPERSKKWYHNRIILHFYGLCAVRS